MPKPTALPTPAKPHSRCTRTIPDGPLYCPELGRSLPLDLSIPQAAALVGRSERAMYRAKELDQLPGVAISGGEYRVGTARLLAIYGLTVGSPR